MLSSRPTFSSCCANGGASRARRDGCLPASPGCFPATAGSTSVRATFTGSFAWQRHALALPSVSVSIRCGTAERCRTAALGGHVERCEDCAHLRISYNSCRNRHCPKCQAAAAKEWLADRQAELLPVPYFHVVFTLPGPIADIAYQNKAVVYDLLLKTAAETLITIAADPKHLGARIGLTAVLHTWGSTLTHHPHAHIIVPGGGFSPDRQ